MNSPATQESRGLGARAEIKLRLKVSHDLCRLRVARDFECVHDLVLQVEIL